MKLKNINISKKALLSLTSVLFLVSGLLFGLKAVRESTEMRKKATGKETKLSSFKITAQNLTQINVSKQFLKDEEIYPFTDNQRIDGLAIDADIQHNTDSSLIRIILVDDQKNEYLVYETYPLITDRNQFSIKDTCEETCYLDSVYPSFLKIEAKNGSITITDISTVLSTQKQQLDIKTSQGNLKKAQTNEKIIKMNQQIKKRGLKWTAGNSPVCQLPYAEKKKLFGLDKLPNLQGFDCYKKGIFEKAPEEENKQITPSVTVSSVYTESFDWRNRHGANDPSSPYYDGDPDGGGWNTSVKNQYSCGSCWAFASVAVTESLANLYFNQHIDLDLSEQDLVSCSGSGTCGGGMMYKALNYIKGTGVVDETCFPYSATNERCTKCAFPSELTKITGRSSLYTYQEDEVKQAIIEKGPLAAGVYSLNHSMSLVGYDRDPGDGETIWIFKNSWGTYWGEHGYSTYKLNMNDFWVEIPISPVITTNYSSINCNDYDNDNYCYWGISTDKPSSCSPSCYPERDCDDSNPNLGPYNADYSCVSATPSLSPTPTSPTLSPTQTPTPTLTPTPAPCDGSGITMSYSPSPGHVNSPITFDITGTGGQGETYIDDTWSGGTDCSGYIPLHWEGSQWVGSKTCNATSQGTYTWTHLWKLTADGPQCQKTKSYTIDPALTVTPTSTNTPTPTPTPTPTMTPTPTPTSTPTSTPYPTPTTPPEGDNMTIKFKVQGVGGSKPPQPFKVTVRKDSQVLFTDNQMSISSNDTGVFTFSIDTSSFCSTAGTVDLLIKSNSHLQKKYESLTLTCGSTSFDFTTDSAAHLIAGDVNGDNILDILDIASILTLYTDLSVSVPSHTPQDINFDEVITIDDVAFILINYTDIEIPGDN